MSAGVNFHAEDLYARLDIVGVTWVSIHLIPRSLWTDLLLPRLVHIEQGSGLRNDAVQRRCA
jgi:hypothetical protein